MPTNRDFEPFVATKPAVHRFETQIVDFCFNPSNTHLFVCCSNGKVEICNADAKPFEPPIFVQMKNNHSVREIICFNDFTLFMALETNKIVSISKIDGKNDY